MLKRVPMTSAYRIAASLVLGACLLNPVAAKRTAEPPASSAPATSAPLPTDSTASRGVPAPADAAASMAQDVADTTQPEASRPASHAKVAPFTPWQWLVSSVLILIGVLLLLAPLWRYLRHGWQAKRKDITDGLGAEARAAYFRMFERGEPPPEDPVKAFDQLYSIYYGQQHFKGPGLLLGLTGLVGTILVVLTTLHTQHFLPRNPLFDLPETAIAALAGAYLWVVNDLLSRARRLDFAPTNVQQSTLRLVIAVPMGYAFASIAPTVGPFIAFALGAFPLQALTTTLARLSNKYSGVEATAEETHDELIKLQGTNRPIVERLADEDLTTITQMAYCDPVRVAMRSNLPFIFITDCMSQALAWMYFEDSLGKLRPFGMRGAVEMYTLIEAYDNKTSADHAHAVATIKAMAQALSLPEDALQGTLRQIAYDPFTVFLSNIWN